MGSFKLHISVPPEAGTTLAFKIQKAGIAN
jgi:hypothetical protein